MVEYDLYHYGITGQKWGIRRFQYEDGSLTPEGKKRYGVDSDGNIGKRRKYAKDANKAIDKISKEFSEESGTYNTHTFFYQIFKRAYDDYKRDGASEDKLRAAEEAMNRRAREADDSYDKLIRRSNEMKNLVEDLEKKSMKVKVSSLEKYNFAVQDIKGW